MSRIGKKPIVMPEGVQVKIDEKNLITVKGPKGTLTRQIDPAISVEITNSQILVKRPTDQKRHKALHGLYRTLISNMVEGVSRGYKKELELVGIGYKVSNEGQLLKLSLGYSHDIWFELSPEIKVTTTAIKGEKPTIILESYDKELLGMVAAKIRSFRPPEPYKGKGILFKGEIIRRKAGKTVATTAATKT